MPQELNPRSALERAADLIAVAPEPYRSALQALADEVLKLRRERDDANRRLSFDAAPEPDTSGIAAVRRARP